MAQSYPARASVAIAGLGSVGRVVAQHLATMDQYELTAASARDLDRAKTFLAEHAPDATVVPLHDLAGHADIVVECAPAEHFRTIAEPVIAAGGTLIPLSVGALLDSWSLVDDAARTGARILVPTGALVGLDAVQAAAKGDITSVRMTTRKPVAGLKNSPFVTQSGIGLRLRNSGAGLRLGEGGLRLGLRSAGLRPFKVGLELRLPGLEDPGLPLVQLRRPRGLVLGVDLLHLRHAVLVALDVSVAVRRLSGRDIAARRPERLLLLAAKLFLRHAVLALELEMLPNGIVENAHRAEA